MDLIIFGFYGRKDFLLESNQKINFLLRYNFLMEGNKTIEVSIVVLCYKASTLIRSFLDEIIIEGDKRSLKYEIVLVVNYWANQHDPTPKMIKDYAKNAKNCVVISKEKRGIWAGICVVD